MLRVNVATRPFYNERGVHLVLALVGLALLALTAFNVSALMRLSGREAELTARISKEETRARELRREAQKLRASVRQDELETVLAAAREANDLIDRRTFSWTALFNHLEATLPEDVMLTTVRPVVEQGQFRVTLGVIGREVGDIDTFMIRLEETGAFRDVLSRDEQARDDGAFEAVLVAIYVPEALEAPAAAGQAGAPGASP
jgi:type IV pilus assembly protein PilN